SRGQRDRPNRHAFRTVGSGEAVRPRHAVDVARRNIPGRRGRNGRAILHRSGPSDREARHGEISDHTLSAEALIRRRTATRAFRFAYSKIGERIWEATQWRAQQYARSSPVPATPASIRTISIARSSSTPRSSVPNWNGVSKPPRIR